MLDVRRGPPDGIDRPRINRLILLRMPVVTSNLSAVRPGIHDQRVRRIRCNVPALATTHVVPIRTIDATFSTRAGNSYGCVVLLRAIDVIRKPVVGGDMVELRCGLVVLAAPAFAAIR